MVTEVLVLVGVVLVVAIILSITYVAWGYATRQQTTVDDVKTRTAVLGASLDSESRKLTNLKDDVNTAFDDWNKTWSSNVSGLDVFFQTTKPAEGSASAVTKKFLNFSSFDSDAQGKARLDLMRHTTALGGLTATDLGNSGKQVKLCYKDGSATSCVQFPDTDGNVLLDAMTGKKIIANKSIAFGAADGPSIGAQASDLLLSSGSTGAVKVSKLQIGNVTFTANADSSEVIVAGGTLKFDVAPQVKSTDTSGAKVTNTTAAGGVSPTLALAPAATTSAPYTTLATYAA